MYDIEALDGSVHENYWTDIGKIFEFPIHDINATETDTKNVKRAKSMALKRYNVDDMIEPDVKYKVFDPNNEQCMKSVPFHQALEQEINKTLFKGKELWTKKSKNKIKEIKKLKWNQRTDDEVCATIKSLQNAMEVQVHNNCDHEIEEHVMMAQKLQECVSVGNSNRNFESYQGAKRYIETIDNVHRDSLQDGENTPFAIDHTRMVDTTWIPWFMENQNRVTEESYKALRDIPKLP